MRTSIFTMRLALVAGTALAVAACGSRPAATNTTANAVSIANDLSMPMNDASAIETTANASAAPPPSSNMTNAADAAPIGPTSGGDTGGNTMQSNITGM